jgi:hypothetical protein
MINNKVILLVSGNLGFETLKNLFHKKEFQLAAVFTDSKSISIIDFCRANNINLFKGNPREGKASTFVANLSCDLLLSVNYLFIIEQDRGYGIDHMNYICELFQLDRITPTFDTKLLRILVIIFFY